MNIQQRQDALIDELQKIHQRRIELGHGGGGAWVGVRARLKRLFVEEMVAAGHYSRERGYAIADQCDAAARNNADMQALMAQLGCNAP